MSLAPVARALTRPSPSTGYARKFLVAAWLLGALAMVEAATGQPMRTPTAEPDWALAPQSTVLNHAIVLTTRDNESADRLLAKAEAAKEAVRNGDSARRSAVESIRCRAYFRQRQRDAATAACEWASALARSSGNPLALSLALRMSAVVALDAENTTAAITLLREARTAAESAKHSGMLAATLNTLGVASEVSGFEEDATRYYAEAFRAATSAREPGVAALAAANLGMLHVASRQPTAALRRVEAGLPLARAADNPQIAFVMQAVQAESLVQLGRVDEAMDLLDRVIPEARNADDRVVGHLQMALARAQLARRDAKAAVISAQRAVELVHNSVVRRAFAELALADALVADGQVEAALQRLRNLDAKNTSLAGARADALARTGELLISRGQLEEGARFLKAALDARAQLQAARAREQLAYLSAQLDADQREGEIARLKAQQTAVEAEAARSALQRDAAIVVALLLMLGAFGWWRLRRVERQRTRLAGAVVSHREALEASTTRAAEMERELEHKRRLEALGRLTVGAANDLQSLLTQIHGHLSLARELPAAAENPALRRHLERATQNADTAERLAGQLLAFGRRQNLRPERIAPAEFLDSHRQLLEQAAGPGVRFEVATGAELPMVLVDAAGLTATLVNLLANSRWAVAQRPGAGQVTIRTATLSLAEGDAAAPLLPAGTYLALAVEDDGCGMTAEVLARAAEPFFTTRDQGEASGLGLSMVQAFARQAGGELLLDSHPGRGTTATLLLPAAA